MVSTSKIELERKEIMPQDPVVADYLDDEFDIYENMDPIGVSIK